MSGQEACPPVLPSAGEYVARAAAGGRSPRVLRGLCAVDEFTVALQCPCLPSHKFSRTERDPAVCVHNTPGQVRLPPPLPSFPLPRFPFSFLVASLPSFQALAISPLFLFHSTNQHKCPVLPEIPRSFF